MALRPDPDGLGRRLGLDPGDPDVDSGWTGAADDDGREGHAKADRQANTGTDAHANADAERDPGAEPHDRILTTAAIAAVAGPISSAPPDAAPVPGTLTSDTGLDPWAVIALAAALLLVVGATIVAGSGRNPGVRASARARTGGTAPRQRS